MIDIRKAKQEFKKYVSNYDIKNDRIRVKIAHIERTASIAKEIAQNLKLSEEDIQLAELIGLLHDIGRFEQVKKYNTFIDKNSVNHGQLGVQILFEQGLIYNFLEDRQYDEIIRKSILNHNRNKANIETSNDREKMHTNIIRDADKLDLMYEAVFIYWQEPKDIQEIENGKLSEKMLADFYQGKLADNRNRISRTDQILRFVSFIFDINFPYSFRILKEKDFISHMINRFDYQLLETKEQMEKVKKIANQKLEEMV